MLPRSSLAAARRVWCGGRRQRKQAWKRQCQRAWHRGSASGSGTGAAAAALAERPCQWLWDRGSASRPGPEAAQRLWHRGGSAHLPEDAAGLGAEALDGAVRHQRVLRAGAARGVGARLRAAAVAAALPTAVEEGGRRRLAAAGGGGAAAGLLGEGEQAAWSDLQCAHRQCAGGAGRAAGEPAGRGRARPPLTCVKRRPAGRTDCSRSCAAHCIRVRRLGRCLRGEVRGCCLAGAGLPNYGLCEAINEPGSDGAPCHARCSLHLPRARSMEILEALAALKAQFTVLSTPLLPASAAVACKQAVSTPPLPLALVGPGSPSPRHGGARKRQHAAPRCLASPSCSCGAAAAG